MTTKIQLSQQIYLRRPTPSDLPAITALVILNDLAEMGETDYSQEELEADWQRPNFDPAQDTWLAIANGGQPAKRLHLDAELESRCETFDGLVVGYEELADRGAHAFLMGDGYVHPAYTGLGIGTALLRQNELRARAHLALADPEVRVSLRNGVSGNSPKSARLHEGEGYQDIRHFYRMKIHLQIPPAKPAWPPGLTVRTVIPGQDDRQVFAAFEEAFRDHWRNSLWDYTGWHARMMETEGFDPSLWFLAWDGDEIAGGALCSWKLDEGFVSSLAVRRPYRRNGLGLALLRCAFSEFYRRGTHIVGLGVDAENVTGATRLYERAGMHVAHEFVIFEKELRPGRPVEAE